jgi:histidinol dehydrogenase
MQVLDYAKDRDAIAQLLKRRVTLDEQVVSRAREILQDVEQNGDEAVLRYTREYDGGDRRWG